jgi:hypothetical protein
VASEACKKLDYRVVHPADKSLVLNEESWPADAKWVKTAFLASDEGQARPDATPRFILAQDGQIILACTGNAGWKDKMWPKILEVTGTAA